MRVSIGPVASSSVTAWVGYARKALAEVIDEPGGDGVWLPDDTVATFEHYLDDWEHTAGEADPFRWTDEVPSEEAEYLSHAFFRIVTNLAAQAEERGYALAPESGDEFYRALVSGFLDALEAEGHGSEEFAEHLRSFWPGLGTEE